MKSIQKFTIFVGALVATNVAHMHAYSHTIGNTTAFAADVEVGYLDPLGAGLCKNDRFKLEPSQQKTINAGACTLKSVQATLIKRLPIKIQNTAPFPVVVVIEYLNGCPTVRQNLDKPGQTLELPANCTLKSVTATGVVKLRMPDQNFNIQETSFKVQGVFESSKLIGNLLVIDWPGKKKADELADQITQFEAQQRRNPQPRQASKPAGRVLVPSVMQQLSFFNTGSLTNQTKAQGFSKFYSGNGTWLIKTDPQTDNAFIITVETMGLESSVESGLNTAYDKMVEGVDKVGEVWEAKRKIGKKLREGADELEKAPKQFEDGIIPLKAMPDQLDEPQKEIREAIIKIHRAAKQAAEQGALIKALNLPFFGFTELNTNIMDALTKLQSALLKLTDNDQGSPNKCSKGALCLLAENFGSSKRRIQEQIKIVEEQIKVLREKLAQENMFGQTVLDRMRRAAKVLEV